MRHHFRILSLAVLCGACAAATALAQANFRDMVTFGDSLTHNDILGLVYGNPQDMYGSDPNQCVFEKGSSSGDELNSYAIAGSESGDIAFQISLYNIARTLGTQDRPTIFGFEIGGNDILNNIDVLANNPPGSDPNVDAIINNCIANIRDSVRSLALSNRTAQWIIWTIPDVTYCPENFGLYNTQQIANIRAHTERVNVLLRGLTRYRQFVVFDTYSQMPAVIENPPVLRGVQLQTTPVYGRYDGIFADVIHPTAVGNALTANFIIQSVNSRFSDNIPYFNEDQLADLARIP